ncbi:MAG: leucine-rich repeat protein [Lachnospiraceae bacterium]|nr:leucine-rich repeat protein [Lachnospiraceae bacterium]
MRSSGKYAKSFLLFITAAAVCLSLFMILPVNRVCAQEGYTINGLWWGFDSATGTITWVPDKWQGGELPSEIGGVKVTGIGEWACCNNDEGRRDHVTKIIIPDGVTRIDKGAFYKCRITSITIPAGVQVISDQAFSNCSCLKEVKIPSGVKVISDQAFSNCSCLEEIRIPEGVEEIGQSCFYKCRLLTRADIPKSMKKIGNYAFYGCEDFEEVNYAGRESDISFGKNVYGGCIWLHPDFSGPYKTSKYYRNLMDLKFSGDYAEDAIAVAASQEGYNEGKSFEDLDGMNRDYSKSALKDYTEFNYYIGRPEWLWRPGLSEVGIYGGWCGHFCGWCLNMAGIPNEAHQYLNDEPDEEHVLWKDTVYAGGKYVVKPGDVLHMKEGHYALVAAVTEKKNSVVFGTWNGNWPGVVWHEFEYNKKDGTMVDRSWSNDDITEILKYEPEVIEKLAHYTVKFDANGGKASQKSKDICEGAYFGPMPVPVRDGYTFDGWYTAKTGGKKITAYRKAREIGNITLYAHWTEKSGKSGNDGESGNNDKPGNDGKSGDNGKSDGSSSGGNGNACDPEAQPDVSVSAKTVKLSALKKADQTVTISQTGCGCKASFANKTSGKLKKYVTVSKSGVVTIGKGAPKGTVKIKVTLKPLDGGNKVTKTVKIKVK